MKTKFISPYFSVSPQIAVSDLEKIAEQGFRTIINNRPDGESDDQPCSSELKAEATRLGMNYQDIPVTPGQLSEQNLEEFGTALESAKAPIFAFCRTGTRCMTLWALNATKRLDVEAIIKTADKAGYDFDGMRDKLEKMSESD